MKKKYLKIMLILSIVIRLVFPFLTKHPDVFNHVDWGRRFYDYKASKFYDPSSNIWSYTWPNQPPGTILIFAGVQKLYEFIYSVLWWLNLNIQIFPSKLMYYIETDFIYALAKLPAIIADFACALLIYKLINLIKKSKVAFLGSMLYLLNPVIWYNSLLWGQYDSVITFFFLASLYYLFKKRLFASLFLFALSFYIKLSLVIFVPIYAIYIIKSEKNIKKVVFYGLLTLLIFALISIPFAKGNSIIWLYNLYSGKILLKQLQVITANAFNLWVLISGIHERPHDQVFILLSYKSWGWILFILSYIPVIFKTISNSRKKHFLFSLAIISFSSFMLLTNMHERYLYWFFPIFLIYAINNRFLMRVYWMIAAINLVNLYNFWWYPKINIIVDVLSFGDRIMPRILGFFSFSIFIITYSYFLRLPHKTKV